MHLASSPGVRGWRVGGKHVQQQMQFVFKASDASKERKLSMTIASYLPTGLLSQLNEAVLDERINPRVPQERLGIYVCFRLSGLHTLTELPIHNQSATIAELVVHTFSTMVAAVEDRGGELLRFTGDMAIALWPLAVPSKPSAASEGGCSMQHISLHGTAGGHLALSHIASSKDNRIILYKSTVYTAQKNENHDGRAGEFEREPRGTRACTLTRRQYGIENNVASCHFSSKVRRTAPHLTGSRRTLSRCRRWKTCTADC